MRSHVSKSNTYLLILAVSLLIAAISLLNTNTRLQVNAFIPFNSQPLFVSEPTEENPAAAVFNISAIEVQNS
ncbi:MAG: hypothetical protein HWE27_07720 [Gammaproteobacteria bacterium]|nr:hypothetical protein [Gammaproteobacteria bacterium]